MADPCHHETDWGALHEWQRRIDEKLDAILAQARTTNGRVGRLEKWKLALTTAVGMLLLLRPDSIPGGIVERLLSMLAAP